MMQRIVKFWLPLAVVFLGIAWFSQWHYDPEKEAKAGLERLNHWRAQAGIQELRPNPALTQAAQNHAAYLGKDAHGHQENNRRNPHYTGADPQVIPPRWWKISPPATSHAAASAAPTA